MNSYAQPKLLLNQKGEQFDAAMTAKRWRYLPPGGNQHLTKGGTSNEYHLSGTGGSGAPRSLFLADGKKRIKNTVFRKPDIL